jgi:hypothetical protein
MCDRRQRKPRQQLQPFLSSRCSDNDPEYGADALAEGTTLPFFWPLCRE